MHHSPKLFRWCGLDLAQQISTADLVARASVVSRYTDIHSRSCIQS